VPLQPGDIIVVCLLAFALIGVPAAVAYLVFGVLRREPPTEVPPPDEPERVGVAPRHGRRHATRSHRTTRAASLDLRNRFGRS
jgi:hypothetical protein